jgi:hypothetical protein
VLAGGDASGNFRSISRPHLQQALAAGFGAAPSDWPESVLRSCTAGA